MHKNIIFYRVLKYGSENPYPHQNVKDSEHWLKVLANERRVEPDSTDPYLLKHFNQHMLIFNH
jgi:hypothetical protein